MKKTKKTPFTRGFKEVNDNIKGKKSKYMMSCYSCDYFYQDEGDEDELCQNPNVLEYDMVFEENNMYCNRWQHTCSDCKKRKKSEE